MRRAAPLAGLDVQAHRVRHGKPDVLARLAAGEDVDSSKYTIRTTVSIETSAPDAAWLNTVPSSPWAPSRSSGVSYDVFLVG